MARAVAQGGLVGNLAWPWPGAGILPLLRAGGEPQVDRGDARSVVNVRTTDQRCNVKFDALSRAIRFLASDLLCCPVCAWSQSPPFRSRVLSSLRLLALNICNRAMGPGEPVQSRTPTGGLAGRAGIIEPDWPASLAR